MDKLRYTGKNIACALFVVVGLLLLSGCATIAGTTKKCPFDKPAVSQMQQQAKVGNPAAQLQVGLWYESGRCLNQDYSEADKWFLKSAEQGHAKVLYQIADTYRYRKNDIDSAIKWYQKAANAGSALAARFLGYFYHYGQYVEKDIEMAEKWYSLGAELGDTTSDHMLRKIKKERDPEWQLEQKRLAEEKAAEALRHAEERYTEFLLLKEKAEQGDREAQYKLGKIYSSGSERIEKDLTQAVNWIKKSADQGYLAAEIYMIAKENKRIVKLIGIWEGEFYSSTNWFNGPVKLQINEQKNEVYTGRVLEFTHHSLSCKGAEVKMHRVNGRRFSINFKHGSLCNVEGELQYGSEAFKGTIVFRKRKRNRKATLVLAKGSGDSKLRGYRDILEGYPDNWPATTNSDDIEDRISGKYSCNGMGHTRNSIIRKSEVQEGKGFPTCKYFEFENANNGGLRLRLWSENGKKAYEKVLVKGKDYSIRNGWIKLKSDSTSGSPGGGGSGIVFWFGVVGRETSFIGLTASNHIVTRTISSEAGVLVLYVIPLPVYYENPPKWGLFERL